jgi:hypothetical protein
MVPAMDPVTCASTRDADIPSMKSERKTAVRHRDAIEPPGDWRKCSTISEWVK